MLSVMSENIFSQIILSQKINVLRISMLFIYGVLWYFVICYWNKCILYLKSIQYFHTVTNHRYSELLLQCCLCIFNVKREPFILYIHFPCVILHPAYIFWQTLWASQWPAHSGALHLFSLITMRSAQSYTFPSHPKTQIEARLASTDSLHSLLLFSLSHQANPSSNSCPLAS